MISDLNQEDSYKRFIDSGWERFAAVAWQHYIAEGRGVLYLDLGLADPIGCGFASAEFQYATPASWPLLFVDETARAIAEYDPQREVVFVLYLPNEEVLTYVVSAKISPPEAYLSQVTREVAFTTMN